MRFHTPLRLILLQVLPSEKEMKQDLMKNAIYNEYNVTSIGCFHCTSIGGDNPACEDPFNSTEAFQKGLYKDNCLAGLKGRGGLYPATACIKFDGYYSKCFSTVLENKSKVSTWKRYF